MGKVGLYFYVNGKVLIDLADIEDAELYGDFKIGKSSHYEIWEDKYYMIYHKPYDYFPRGRVAYNYKENKYFLYADKCIDKNGIQEIMKAFGIEDEKLKIDRKDRHYVCKTCNKHYLE